MRASFFALLILASTARGQAPWLPEKEQAYLRSLIPANVPFTDNARFFRLPQKYQELVVVNSTPTRTIRLVTKQEDPWIVSGGMHWVSRSIWRNATALDIPKGRHIMYWVENVDAGAPVPVPKIRWAFPLGTVAYDVLIRTHREQEFVFEVRIQEKTEFGWDHGETYRPDVFTDNLARKDHKFNFAFGSQRSGFPVTETIDASLRWYKTDHIDPKIKFVRTSKVVVDGGLFVPRGYYGAGLRCATCHQMVGRRTGYGTIIRGDDGRFSWHPFSATNSIDGRWPLVPYRLSSSR